MLEKMWLTRESLQPLPRTETVLSVAASLAASAILFRSIFNDLVPGSVQDHFYSSLQRISTRMSPRLTVVIEESDGLITNQVFRAANIYLGSNAPISSTSRIQVLKPEKERNLTVTVDKNQELLDVFKGVKLRWVLVSSPVNHSVGSNKRSNGSAFERSEMRRFELSFHKKHRDMVLSSYLPYILEEAKAIKEEKKTLKLHTIDYGGTDYWGSINFDHPATFDTIAMDPETKKLLIEDLDRFVAGKEFYRKVGKAWKRGYLLYGPPGTGKSSLVGAMANYLRFNVYDLDLKEVQCNSDLRRLLIGTSNRSILVIEDIDRSFESVEDDKVTLSALQNFIDGLWSSCGDERILVFTTNYKDLLDPVLLRPGRMDLHVEMSYCSYIGFKTLACNYLQVEEHHLFGVIEELLEKVKATPAEVAGELMKSGNADIALQGLINFLKNKVVSVNHNGSESHESLFHVM